ncbi:hypothetical protein BCV70DRAFT_206879 [Testicularia cyperi]|uniref:Uncharacterized protein n=1 Tax=Testicularia cyperi TaxID=1882483 RepID=A0A317XLP0_9BASI|nr:hypothetical protein BCV70DRAFT_206879 [Testicularia cyperi]
MAVWCTVGVLPLLAAMHCLTPWQTKGSRQFQRTAADNGSSGQSSRQWRQTVAADSNRQQTAAADSGGRQQQTAAYNSAPALPPLLCDQYSPQLCFVCIVNRYALHIYTASAATALTAPITQLTSILYTANTVTMSNTVNTNTRTYAAVAASSPIDSIKTPAASQRESSGPVPARLPAAAAATANNADGAQSLAEPQAAAAGGLGLQGWPQIF